MKVVVNIGDIVDYSDCGFFMDENALTVALNTIEESCSIDIENDRKRVSICYPNEMDSIDYDVFEEHEVADDWKYLLISWHCFDGIESAVREFDSIIEAREKMEWEVSELDGEIELKSDNKAVVDAGHEWLGWKIIDRKELYEI